MYCDRFSISKLGYDNNIVSNGSLLQSGKERMHNIGNSLKKRYVDITGDENWLNLRNLDLHSTVTNRTIESLSSLISGLANFVPTNKPSDESSTINNINSTNAEHMLLLVGSSTCEKSRKIIFETLNSGEWCDYILNHKESIELIFNLTQTRFEGWDIIKIFDTLFIEHELGHKLPEGMNDSLYEESQRFRDDLFLISYPTHREDFCQPSSGLFMDELFFHNIPTDLARRSSESLNFKPGYHHYSAHDASIIILAGCLGLDFEGTCPRYGSLFVTEVYMNEENASDPIVEFLYDKGPDQDGTLHLKHFSSPFCEKSEPCTLSHLQHSFQKMHEIIQKGEFIDQICGRGKDGWWPKFVVTQSDEKNLFTKKSDQKLILFVVNAISAIIIVFTLYMSWKKLHSPPKNVLKKKN
eukprot:MONOS_16794.1-p1 / transcript=MONOS_16794.1 / gene=MONOS_16794 / organism=Monocercomonoides_exilis_PA203 / gene_product=unspecified product / transcript_product=unspecified product / location=Mono_scaffold00280:3006-6489(+) / protein_length=411 / sequence_SO=supercontig / SO=protein_coding / is_pseudo=false